ncbi:MAG TPA: oligopeptide ABC transporter ATP-binding protein OppF [Spirochaetia bacterium]|nr:MAG: hypothetical protein A2Y41_01645 [Spirochaetes bacterium GWB1_36_13]HCL57212.1 oligopeptide ABC transporter ATP-binding protein OppF [Spirochaetia bacterium]
MLKISQLTVSYDGKKAVSNLSFKVKEKQNLGIIGESGSGKTTVARSIMRLLPKKLIDKKSLIEFQGQNILTLNSKDLKKIRKSIQIVFQDPFSSFNPRQKTGNALEEPLTIHKINQKSERKEKVLALFNQIGLSEDSFDKYPHEFSGGQRQRLAIARSLILNPSLLIADEPVSSLDVSVQAQILNLLLRLKEEYSLTYILIAHDLAVVDYFCDQVLVIYKGELMEYGSREILKHPLHPYTQLLLDSVPGEGKKIQDPIENLSTDSLCPFAHRCPKKNNTCRSYDGSYLSREEGRFTTCVRAFE